MTGAKHTPGPWAAVQVGTAPLKVVRRVRSGRIGSIETEIATVHTSAADAILLASTPDLLAALKFGADVVTRKEWILFLKKARAVIAKAEARP